MNAQGLKYPRGRVLVALAAGSRLCATRAIISASCRVRSKGRDSRSFTMARAMRGARRSSPYSRKMRISSSKRRAVDHVGGAHPDARRHAHVERPVLREAEAARGIVELRRGHAQIEQDAVELETGFDLVRTIRQGGKRREKNRHARIGSEARPGLRDGRGIAIEAQQTTVRDEVLQNRPCMSASPKSGVQVGATRPYVQPGQYLR